MANTRRKLTTILCPDVADYSRLMGADEDGTHAALMHARHALTRHIEAHDGRFVNSWGDAVIAEFASVVEALRAAIEIQSDMESMNRNRPNDTNMHFRIGLNLGDVIAEGSDIYGDGVNIAARLQAAAPAGGIVISRAVYDQVHTKLDLDFLDLGTLVMKNIASVINGYSVHPSGSLSTRIGPRTARLQPSGPDANAAPAEPANRSPRIWRGLVVLLVAVNLITWNGTFWARWPLLALAASAADRYLRKTRGINHGTARLAIAAATIMSVNVLTWHGSFWAAWPMLALATAGGLRHLRPTTVKAAGSAD